MNFSGFTMPVLAIGLGSIRVKPQRGFYPQSSPDPNQTQPFVPHAALEEMHRDDLEITEHPVELGAPIADHAFKRPAEVVIRCAWSNSPPGTAGLLGAAVGVAGTVAPVVGQVLGALEGLTTIESILSGESANQAKAIYAQLIELQESRIPFDVYTGKRVYKNMLFKSLGVTTDLEHENSLLVTATCRQVILTSTQTVDVPVNAAATTMPQNAPLFDRGTVQLRQKLGSGLYGIF